MISPKLDGVGWDAARQQSSTDDYSYVSFTPTGSAKVADLNKLAATYAFTTGNCHGGSLRWEEAAEKFCEEMAPCVARAGELGVRLAVEPTNPLRTDVSFVHTVRDAVHLARMADMSVAVDFYSSWYERGLEETVRDNIDLVSLVQIDDYKLGTFDIPNRCAIGDGDIPVERLMRWCWMPDTRAFDSRSSVRRSKRRATDPHRGASKRERDARPPRCVVLYRPVDSHAAPRNQGEN